MANNTLINLLAWCKRERERLQMQREMLQSGRFRIFEKDDSGQQRDISNQHIEQIAANIAELDRIIIADYEAKTVSIRDPPICEGWPGTGFNSIPGAKSPHERQSNWLSGDG
jgi:hypothetical protein